MYSVCKQTAFTDSVDVHFSTYMYMNSPTTYDVFFLLLIALLDTCTSMISRLGIVIRSVEETRLVYVKIHGIKLRETIS